MRVRSLLWAFFFLGTAAVAQEVCAVTLFVSDERGKPLSVPLRLNDPTGKTLAWTTANPNGKAEFCDFGFGYHSILIGGDKCNSILIRKVRFRYPVPYIFRVSMPSCEEQGDVVGVACPAYFRVVTDSGTPVPAVSVTIEGVTTPLKTDDYGRVLAAIPLGKTKPVSATFSAPGHETKTIQVTCGSRWEIEEEVLLKKATR